MGFKVETIRKYRHPKTRKPLSSLKAKQYMRRTGRRLKPEVYLLLRHYYSPEELKIFPQRKREQGRIMTMAKLTTVETITKTVALHDRKIRQTLADQQVYKKIWANDRGHIRITLSGMAGGKRIKEIIHASYYKGSWEGNYEGFKDWLVGMILSNVRRRGLRVSNPKESQWRINDLRKKLHGVMGLMQVESKAEKLGALAQRAKWLGQAIQRQKRSTQMRGVTLRIEKLA